MTCDPCCQNFGAFIGGGALLAGATVLGAMALGGPVGIAAAAVTGAIEGTVSYLAGATGGEATNCILNGCDTTTNSNCIVKIIAAAAAFFASVGVTFGITSALGMGMTFWSVALLSVVSGGIAIGVVLAIVLLAMLLKASCS